MGVLRPVLPGHVVLLPQVGVGHAGGLVNVHAGHGTADRAGRRKGARKAEEDTRQLHAHPHQKTHLVCSQVLDVRVHVPGQHCAADILDE